MMQCRRTGGGWLPAAQQDGSYDDDDLAEINGQFVGQLSRCLMGTLMHDLFQGLLCLWFRGAMDPVCRADRSAHTRERRNKLRGTKLCCDWSVRWYSCQHGGMGGRGHKRARVS